MREIKFGQIGLISLKPGIDVSHYHSLYKQIYDLTDSPVIKGLDCGSLCSGKCCSSEDGRGIYLYPYEEVMFDGTEEWLEWRIHTSKWYELPEPISRMYFLRCSGSCKREKRPLQCRIYPFAFRLDSGGKLEIGTSDFGHGCSILGGGYEADPSFLNNLVRAGEILLTVPEACELIKSMFLEK